MNLTTVLVTLVIAGSATPGITKLALQPIIAQKRATNFGVAETQAVTFAAKNEGQISLTKTPDDCKLEDIGGNAYTITCWEGKSKYRMSATRAFRQWTFSPGTKTAASGFNSNSTGVSTTATDVNSGAGSASVSASGTSHDENYETNVNQSHGGGTSHDENYATNVNQSHGGGTSHNENHTKDMNQSHRSRTSYDDKHTTSKDHSSSDRRSHDEKQAMREKQSFRGEKSTDREENRHQDDKR